MVYLMIGIFGIAIVWIAYYIISEINKPPLVRNTIHDGEEANSTKEYANKQSQKSLDVLYASSHGMWVCCRCETLNDGMAMCCCACGTQK